MKQTRCGAFGMVGNVGHFWSYLLNSFPEMLDFLASVEELERDDFVNVIEVMYEHYFEANQTFKCQLNNVVTDRCGKCGCSSVKNS
eukprot:1136744-Pelagomonas_calceolata.AAC.1